MKETVIKNFPLFCPKCKKETLINVKQFKMEIIKKQTTENYHLYAGFVYENIKNMSEADIFLLLSCKGA